MYPARPRGTGFRQAGSVSLAHGLMSINAVKGVEVRRWIRSRLSTQRGSEHRDEIGPPTVSPKMMPAGRWAAFHRARISSPSIALKPTSSITKRGARRSTSLARSQKSSPKVGMTPVSVCGQRRLPKQWLLSCLWTITFGIRAQNADVRSETPVVTD